jgi:hypothetical protein
VLWNQSAQEQNAAVFLDASLAKCSDKEARVWRDNAPAAPIHINDNRFTVTVAPKGIIALAIPADVHPRLQSHVYADAPAVTGTSHREIDASFGRVHAMLLSAGRGLTSAYVYTDALPEQVIAARLHWRQGDGPWREMIDDIYPYEFSPDLRDDAGTFECVLEVLNEHEQIQRAPLIALGGPPSTATPALQPFPKPSAVELIDPPKFSDDFIAYLQRAANGSHFGLRSDHRYYPYSTPQGRRIAARQMVWDLSLYATGCTQEEAERHFRSDLGRAQLSLQKTLGMRTPPVDFERLD